MWNLMNRMNIYTVLIINCIVSNNNDEQTMWVALNVNQNSLINTVNGHISNHDKLM